MILRATLSPTLPVSAQVTNGTGSPTVAMLSTGELAFISESLGPQHLIGVIFGVTAALSGAGLSLISASLVWTYGAEGSISLTLDGANALSALELLTPGGSGWTGDILEATTVRVDAEVTVPAHTTATLTVSDLTAAAYAASGRATAAGISGASASGESGTALAGGIGAGAAAGESGSLAAGGTSGAAQDAAGGAIAAGGLSGASAAGESATEAGGGLAGAESGATAGAGAAGGRSGADEGAAL